MQGRTGEEFWAGLETFRASRASKGRRRSGNGKEVPEAMRSLYLVIAVMLLLALGSLEVLASRSASTVTDPYAPVFAPWR